MYYYDRTQLNNGIELITERIPHVRSVSVGIWIAAGSRYEPRELAGVSHFLEHLLFKGTENRTAREISLAIDSVGGRMNAFTAKEYTCFYARVLDEHLPLAIDVLADMVCNALLEPEDIANERSVILEEINMYEDSPDDLVHVVLSEAIWPDHPLGGPVIGSQSTVREMTPEQVRGHFDDLYRPERTVVAVAGNIEHEMVVEQVSRRLAGWESGKQSEPAAAAQPTGHRSVSLRQKDTEQAHLVVGGPALAVDDDQYYVLSVLSTVLGGGSSSRLFQEIREKRALAYSTYSYMRSYLDTGLFGIYAGTSPGRVEEVLGVCKEELRKLTTEGLEPGELERNKEQLKGSLMLSLESTNSRMSRMAKSQLLRGRIQSPDDIIERIDAVKEDQLMELGRELLARERLSLALVGPLEAPPSW